MGTKISALGVSVIVVLLVGGVAASSPAGAAATMTVTPNAGLTGPTVVHVEADGLTETSNYLFECDPALTCVGPIILLADAGGHAAADMLVRAAFVGSLPGPALDVDCTQVSCSLVLFPSAGQPLATVPIEFTPNAAKSGPPASVSPNTGVTSGQALQLTVPAGTFDLAEPVNVLECQPPPNDLPCSAPLVSPTTSAADGSLVVSVAADRFLFGNDPPVPCGSTCALVVLPASPFNGRMAVATFTFAPEVSPTNTTAPPSTANPVAPVAATPAFTG
jgi:hypothetical protein